MYYHYCPKTHAGSTLLIAKHVLPFFLAILGKLRFTSDPMLQVVRSLLCGEQYFGNLLIGPACSMPRSLYIIRTVELTKTPETGRSLCASLIYKRRTYMLLLSYSSVNSDSLIMAPYSSILLPSTNYKFVTWLLKIESDFGQFLVDVKGRWDGLVLRRKSNIRPPPPSHLLAHQHHHLPTHILTHT